MTNDPFLSTIHQNVPRETMTPGTELPLPQVDLNNPVTGDFICVRNGWWRWNGRIWDFNPTPPPHPHIERVSIHRMELEGWTCEQQGRWYRDPSGQIWRTLESTISPDASEINMIRVDKFPPSHSKI